MSALLPAYFFPLILDEKSLLLGKKGEKKSSLMYPRADLAAKKTQNRGLVEVVESKGYPAWGRSWHWGSQLGIWGGNESTGGRAGWDCA